MAISAGAALVVVLVGGQFVVPPIATTVLRQRLARDGTVISARLSAFPWVELLLQRADSVSARLADLTLAPQRITTLLHQAQGVGRVEISVGVLHTGLLTLHDVSFEKRGAELVGAARLDLRDLRAALPIIRSLTPVRQPGGRLVLRGDTSLLGLDVVVDVVVAARDGRLVLAPAGLLGAFATVTLYDDPRIRVRSVAATAVPGGLRFRVEGAAA